MTISLGSTIYTAVKPIFKIYFIIGLGFLLGKRNVLTVQTSRNISDVVLTAILPCLIFDKVVTNISNSDIKQIGIICVVAVFLFLVGGLGSFLVYILTPVPKQWLGGCLSVGFFPNISDLPIAYIQTLDTGSIFTEDDGDKGVAYICIFLAVQMLIQFNMGGYRLIQLDFDKAIKLLRIQDEEMKLGSEAGSSSVIVSATTSTTNNNNNNNAAGISSTDGIENEDAISSMSSLSSEDSLETTAPPPHVPQQQQYKQKTTLETTTSASRMNTNNNNNNKNDVNTNTSIGPVPGPGPNANASGSSRHHHHHDHFLVSQLSAKRSRGLSMTQSVMSNNSINTTTTRNIDLRHLPSQNINDLVIEYSQIDRLRDNEPTVAGLTELSLKPTNNNTLDADKHQEELKQPEPEPKPKQESKTKISTKIYRLIIRVLTDFKRPPSIALILAITIAMIPWVKALFVTTSQASINAAPDGLPPLSFIMDLTEYIANACVPLGLLLLGATLSRLSVGQMSPGFWKVPLALTFLRLIFLPIVGTALVYRLQKIGWFKDDKILEFVCAINFGLPNATSLIYLTAFYTPTDRDDMQLQMDYLSLTYIFEYPILAISLPFLTTFVLKVLLHF